MTGPLDALRAAAAGLAVALLPLSAAWGAGSCHVVARGETTLVPAAYAAARLAEDELRLTFVGHATFLIESPGGVRIATDYNDDVRPEIVPDIATMNLAHSTHHSSSPDPRIKYVLRGWNPQGGSARHDLRVGDVHVRNVPTNIRGQGGGTDYGGNSIFVFETADLCVAHLGHLHHKLTPEHLAELGPIDVVLVPVDGSWTLRLDAMMEVLREIKAPLVIPMHFFGPSTLERFLARAGEDGYEIARSDTPSIVLSRAALPSRPKVLVLPGH